MCVPAPDQAPERTQRLRFTDAGSPQEKEEQELKFSKPETIPTPPPSGRLLGPAPVTQCRDTGVERGGDWPHGRVQGVTGVPQIYIMRKLMAMELQRVAG